VRIIISRESVCYVAAGKKDKIIISRMRAHRCDPKRSDPIRFIEPHFLQDARTRRAHAFNRRASERAAHEQFCSNILVYVKANIYGENTRTRSRVFVVQKLVSYGSYNGREPMA
jgi:hypothetical protein